MYIVLSNLTGSIYVKISVGNRYITTYTYLTYFNLVFQKWEHLINC